MFYSETHISNKTHSKHTFMEHSLTTERQDPKDLFMNSPTIGYSLQIVLYLFDTVLGNCNDSVPHCPLRLRGFDLLNVHVLLVVPVINIFS